MLSSAQTFIRECQDRNYAASTIKTHKESLSVFSEWVEAGRIDAQNCSSDDIERFIQWIKEEKAIPYRDIRSNIYWSLKNYFEYLVETEQRISNPCSDVDIVDCLILDTASRYLSRIRTTKAQRTVENREYGLVQFSEWVDDGPYQDLSAYSPLELEDYAVYLSQKGYGDTTVIDRFAAVSTLYEFKHDKEQSLEENPVEEINLDEAGIVDYKNPTRKTDILAEEISYITEEQKEEMVENCPGPKLRNELLIEFLWQTGLRRREAADVKIENIDRDLREIVVRGKNNDSRTVFYQPSLDTLLNIWLDGGYRQSFTHAESSDYLFLSERSEQLHPHQINQTVVKSAKNADIQSKMYTDGNGQARYKITAHALRHGFAVRSLKNGMDIKTLADIMGHESLDTTKDYLELITDDLRERYRMYGPSGTSE